MAEIESYVTVGGTKKRKQLCRHLRSGKKPVEAPGLNTRSIDDAELHGSLCNKLNPCVGFVASGIASPSHDG
jgi:hypothetical protein